MTSLREKVEALPRYRTTPCQWGLIEESKEGRYYEAADVLRIVAEHEQAQAPVLDLTPGGPVKGGAHDRNGRHVTAPPVGQAGGEPWRKGLPDVRLRRAWEFWECKLDGRWTSRLLEDRDLQLSKAGDYWRPLNKTWSEVEQMARDADGGEAEAKGEPAWLRELARLRAEACDKRK